jgi:hypothetical protein
MKDICDKIYNFYVTKKFEAIINYLYLEIDLLRKMKLTEKIKIKKIDKFYKKILDNPKNEQYAIVFIQKMIALIVRHYKSELLNDKKIYIINIAKDDLLIKLFILHIFSFSNSIQRVSCGLDFEFNLGKNALTQIGLYPNHSKYYYIWIIDINILNQNDIEYLINFIFINKNVEKIVHGSDSLDFPFIFGTLFKFDPILISLFIKHSVDTRFLCEFVKLFKNEEDKKCSLYDALLYFKTINLEQYNILNGINSQMGPISNVNWDIKNMSKSHIYYALYDVYYLKSLLFDIYKSFQDSKKYLSIVIYLYKLTLYDKYEIIHLSSTIKKIIDPMNNYLIPQKKTTMLNLFKKILPNIESTNPKMNISLLININYLRTIMLNILKYITYYCISTEYTIYINKSKRFYKKININELYSIIENVELGKFVIFLKQLQNMILDLFSI